jgi:hypothetical protein
MGEMDWAAHDECGTTTFFLTCLFLHYCYCGTSSSHVYNVKKAKKKDTKIVLDASLCPSIVVTPSTQPQLRWRMKR